MDGGTHRDLEGRRTRGTSVTRRRVSETCTSNPCTRLDSTSVTHVVERKATREREAARARPDGTSTLEIPRSRTDAHPNQVLEPHPSSIASACTESDKREMFASSMPAAMLTVAKEEDKDDSDEARAFSPTFFCIFSSNTLPTVHPCIHTHISFSLLS
jgi:hypothetical protein